MVSVSEREREVLYQSLIGGIGEEGTGILMGLLPLDDGDDVARRSDVAGLRGDVDGLRGDVRALRSDLDGMGRSLRGEIAGLREDMRGEMRGLEGRLRHDVEALGTALRLEMQAGDARLAVGFHRDMVRQTWVLAGTFVAAVSALGALLH